MKLEQHPEPMSESDQQKYEQALAQAISALGTVAFPRRLAALVATRVAADCTLMLGYRRGGPAIYLYDNLRHRRDLLFQQYLSGVYAEDPFYRALSRGLDEGVYSLRTLVAEQGMGPHYMAGFYDATGWQEELGLVVALGEGQWLTLFLGRLAPRPFDREEQARLRRLLPVLGSLCRQHWPKGGGAMAQAPPEQTDMRVRVDMAQAPPEQTDMRARVEQALASLGQSRLTRRERQVAVLLVQGLDNDAIAGELGIGSGTVKNHRKHLYAKLGLDSRAALFAFFINHLITDG